MSLIGRLKEQEELEKVYSSESAEFIAIYGRRRVGKTFLVREFFKSKPGVFFNVTGSKDAPRSEQIKHFHQRIGQVFFNGIEPKSTNSWDETFRVLTEAMKLVPKKQKIVLFFDELPWMATRSSRLLQSLDYYWNQYWSDDHRIKLIICGSSASWIINKVLNNRGGLHNRVTRRMFIKPFSLLETKKFLSAKGVRLKNSQVTEIYMLTGGVPFYLSPVEKGLSSAQVIEKLAFTENALLLDEFDKLFASLFEDEKIYIALLRIIAKHRYGISKQELVKQSKKFSTGGRLTTRLKELTEAGFILSFKSHQNKRRGTYYRVIDEYTLFYLYWIDPIRDTLHEQLLQPGYWQEMQNSAAWHSWSGYAFEAIVYKHLLQVRKVLMIPVTGIANAWRFVPTKQSKEEGAQIDLLFDRRDDVVTLCEIKFVSKPFVINKAYAAQMIRKKEVFMRKTKCKKQIFFSMITANGIQNNPYSDELVTGVTVLNDLFHE